MHPGGCGLYGLVVLSIRSDKDEMRNWERGICRTEIGPGDARETGGDAVSPVHEQEFTKISVSRLFRSRKKTLLEKLSAHGVIHALLVSMNMHHLRLLKFS
jgi:hypothetical protein